MPAPPKWRQLLNDATRLAHQRPGVVGVDYGFVYKDRERLKSHGIRFHVEEKVPLDNLPEEKILPRQMDGLRCDVVEATYALHGSPRGQCDPLELGVSIGNTLRNTAGSLGLFVRDRLSGAQALLSNWHVLCGSPEAMPGEEISQPGPTHAGSHPLRIAAVLERAAGLDLGCDAAIALLKPGIVVRAVQFPGGISVTKVEPAKVGAKLTKYGATSELTHGMIDGIGGSYQVDYSGYGDTKRWIDGIRIVPDPDAPDDEISLAGDSGSVWLNPLTGRAIALHFAGEDSLGPTAEYALAQPIERVFKLLDIDF